MLIFRRGLPLFMFDADGGTTGGENTGGQIEGEGAVGTGAENKDTGSNTDNKPLSADDIKKMIQSETDKVRGEYSKKLKDKEKELEDIRMSSMTDAERKAEELKRERAELDKLRAEASHQKLTLETVDLLKANELPLEAKDFLIGKDTDSTKANIEAFKGMFESVVKAEVQKRFQGTGKQHQDSGKSVSGLTMEDIKKMTPAEINKNWDAVQRVLNGK